jgi:hypothetical protein
MLFGSAVFNGRFDGLIHAADQSCAAVVLDSTYESGMSDPPLDTPFQNVADSLCSIKPTTSS